MINRELIEVFSEIAREKNVERSELATILEELFLYVIEKEISGRLKKAFDSENKLNAIEFGGDYKWRRNGEAHMLNPLTISKLQQSVRQ